jgi:hypothetical protein
VSQETAPKSKKLVVNNIKASRVRRHLLFERSIAWESIHMNCPHTMYNIQRLHSLILAKSVVNKQEAVRLNIMYFSLNSTSLMTHIKKKNRRRRLEQTNNVTSQPEPLTPEITSR